MCKATFRSVEEFARESVKGLGTREGAVDALLFGGLKNQARGIKSIGRGIKGDLVQMNVLKEMPASVDPVAEAAAAKARETERSNARIAMMRKAQAANSLFASPTRGTLGV